MPPRVYILDDDPTMGELVRAELSRVGDFRIQVFDSPRACLDAVGEDPPDALLTDLRMPEMSGIEVVREIREHDANLPVFVITAFAEIDSAIEALKAGATEYLTKPINFPGLIALLNKALDARPLLDEAIQSRERARRLYSVDAIIGEHELVHETREFVRGIAAASRVGVLLLGESGTGKNLVARAIHHAGASDRGRFVALNCAAMPPEVLEAELFGYTRGAPSDARNPKRGLVEIADGGTLFLDEIAELPAGLQARLLNFLESHSFRRMGSAREREVDVRIIASTNRPVDDLLEDSGFRSDLFYRIAVANHTLPALRDIRSDVPLLARHLAERIAADLGREFRDFDDKALELLTAWNWPGNVRELRNLLERSLIFAEGPVLGVADLPAYLQGERRSSRSASTYRIPPGLSLKEAEAHYIRLTLESTDGKVQEAADMLGISRKNLWEKRKRYGLLD